jgi:plastocyanin
MFVPTLACAAFLLAGATIPALAQAHLTTRLIHPSAERFLFQPDSMMARPGDVLEFTVESGGPYVIGFEAADLGPREQALLNAAIPDRTAPLRSAILPRPGSRLQFVLPVLPKGRYRFSAVTHLAYRMVGVLVVR